MPVVLRCPVRTCGEPLKRSGTPWTCTRHHSFDQHAAGYLNLLQPQDRRSANPGDSREAALARRRLADLGYAGEVHSALRHAIGSSSKGTPSALLDVGCGEGAFLRALGELPLLERHGLDLSAPSLALAAKATPEILFVAANADRLLPYRDRSFDLVTSIDARVNSAEFGRILTPNGLFLVAVPGPDDLIELRERIQGARLERTRTTRIVEELADAWSLADQTTVRASRTFDAPALRDLLRATYRGFRQRERTAAESLSPMTVTVSHEVLAFHPNPSQSPRPAGRPLRTRLRSADGNS